MNQAQQEAEEIAKEIRIPVQINKTCEFLSQDGFLVTYEEEDMSSKGFEGISLGDNTAAGIIVNSRITNYERRRFTAAHEIGHVVRHIFPEIKNSFKCKKEDFLNKNSIQPYEKEANDFASSLLLPKFWLKPLIKSNDLVWSFIKDISNKGETSLQATARRLVTLATEEYAFLIQYDNEVWTPIKSPTNGHYIEKTKFPLNLKRTEIENEKNHPDTWDECDTEEWFSSKKPFDSVKYSSIYFPNHKLTMTVLYIPEADTWEDEDVEWEEPHF